MRIPFRRRLLYLGIAQSLALAATSGMPLNSALAVNAPGVDAFQQLESGRQFQRALIELKNAVVERPDDPELRVQLGELYLQIEDGTAAEKEFARAIELGRDDVPTRVHLAEAWLAQRDFQRPFIDAGFKQALEQAEDPQESAALISVQGRARLADGDWEEAESLFQTALAEAPQFGPAQLGLAEAKLAAGDQGGAELALVAAENASDLDAAEWLRARADLAMYRERFTDAEQYYREALERRPTDPRLLRSIAQAKLNQGDVAEAIAALERVLAVMPDDGQATLLLAMAAFEAGDFQQAAAVAARLVGRSDAHPAPLYIAGASSYLLGSLQQAREYLSRFVAMQPEDPDGRRIYGAVLLQTGAGDEAYEMLAPLREDADEDASLLALFGVSAAQAGRYDEAVDALERALILRPDDRALRSQLSAAKLAAGDRNAGMAELESLAAEADSAELYRRLAIAQLGHGEFDRAIEALQRERDGGGDIDPKSLTLEAMALMGQGQLDDAERLLRRAVEQAPDDVNAQLALAELLTRQGDAGKALERLTEVAERNPTHVETQINLARLEMATLRESKALERLRRLVRSEPQRAEARLALVDAYLTLQRWEEAQEAIARAPDPEAPGFLLASGLLALGQARVSDAVRILTRAAEAAPGSVKVKLTLAQALQAQQAFDAALAQIEQAAELAPNSRAVRFERARQVLLHPEPPKNLWDEVLIDLARLQQTEASDPRVGQLTGIWAMRSGKPEKGIELLRIAHDNLRSSDSAVILADALWSLDQRAEATAVLTDWIDLHPQDQWVRARLGAYSHAVGN